MNRFRILLFVMSATTGIASAIVFMQEPDKTQCTPCKIEKKSHPRSNTKEQSTKKHKNSKNPKA